MDGQEYISITAYFKINGIKVSPNAFKKDSEIESKIIFLDLNDDKFYNYMKTLFINGEYKNRFFIPSWPDYSDLLGIPEDRNGKIRIVTIHKKHE